MSYGCGDPFCGSKPIDANTKTDSIDIGDLLELYSMWLTKNGYMDTDWKDEEPYAIDEFLKTLK